MTLNWRYGTKASPLEMYTTVFSVKAEHVTSMDLPVINFVAVTHVLVAFYDAFPWKWKPTLVERKTFSAARRGKRGRPLPLLAPPLLMSSHLFLIAKCLINQPHPASEPLPVQRRHTWYWRYPRSSRSYEHRSSYFALQPFIVFYNNNKRFDTLIWKIYHVIVTFCWKNLLKPAPWVLHTNIAHDFLT